MIADWITDRRAPGNMLDFEIQRFTDVHNTELFLKDRTTEVVGQHYKLYYPYVSEFKTCRKICTSPLYKELQNRGAVHGERMTWERPLYFEPSHDPSDAAVELPQGTFGVPEFCDRIEVQKLSLARCKERAENEGLLAGRVSRLSRRSRHHGYVVLHQV